MTYIKKKKKKYSRFNSVDNLIGYPLKEALKIIEEANQNIRKIINIKKVMGTNNKFNELHKPYVIRTDVDDNYITLFVTYY